MSFIQDDMIVHRQGQSRPKKAADLSDEDLVRHLKRGGGVYLEDNQCPCTSRLEALERSVSEALAAISELQVETAQASKNRYQFLGVQLACST